MNATTAHAYNTSDDDTAIQRANANLNPNANTYVYAGDSKANAKPHYLATSHKSSVHLEVAQLSELTQKPCVLEDFGFTTPSQ